MSELLALIVIGVILAYILANGNAGKTAALFGGLNSLWSKSLNGLLSQPGK